MSFVYLRDSDDLVGTISLTEVVRGSLQAGHLGYSLDQAHNDCRFMTAVFQLVLVYAFCIEITPGRSSLLVVDSCPI